MTARFAHLGAPGRRGFGGAADAAEAAANRREQADTNVEQEGQNLIRAWERHFGSLKQLRVGADEYLAALTALADWVIALQGDNPTRQCLQLAQQQASLNFAQRQVSLRQAEAPRDRH